MSELIRIFPDTNIFLHYRPLGEIDWCSLAGSKSVELVICMTVIHELDNKKGDIRLGDRAKRAIKEIREAKTGVVGVRSNVTLSIYNREVHREEFSGNLSYESADDHIVHQVRKFATENPDALVAIVTADLGMELRADAAGIQTIQLDPSHQLSPPGDELTKEHQKIKNELAAIKSRQPKLVLQLAHEDDEEVRKVRFELVKNCELHDVESLVRDEMDKHPKIGGDSTWTARMREFNADLLAAASDGPRNSYNVELDVYYSEMRKYFEMLNAIKELRSRSIWFDVWLANDGSGIATDVDVTIKFPRIICHIESKDVKRESVFHRPRKPSPPRKPQFGLGRLIEMPSASALQFDYDSIMHEAMSPFGPTIQETANLETEVRFHCMKLKHGIRARLGQLVAIFASPEEVQSFQTEYEISVAEIASKVEGAIPFIIQSASE